ncbi:HDIG domain-containing protein, partial [bacterium]|nr:HDIG domain-containing protein [bacterium]
NRNMMRDIADSGLIRRDMYTQDERVIHNLDTVISLDVAYREIDDSVARLLPDNQLLQDITAEITRSLIRPNLTYNMQETQARKRAARKSVKPVFFQVSAGEVIIKAGEKVTPEIQIRLKQLNKLGKESRLGLIFFGNLLIVTLLAGMVVFNIRRFHPNLDKNRMILIGLIALCEILLCKGFMKLAAIIPEYMTGYPMDSPVPYHYAVPFALGSMLTALLVDERIAVFFSFIYAIIASLMFNNDFLFGLFVVFSGYAGVFAISHYKNRTMILQGGFLVSMANFLVIMVLQMVHGEIDGMLFAMSSLMGLVGGLLVAMIVTVLLPMLEWLFKIPTDIRLLELSNFNEPLLRKLAMNAPGTHHHSLMVGDLAETAAEAIGANALLAKVGAYYHDIGKITQPDYFIENVQGTNPHNKLTPNMSAMIIRKHVKHGVEMARKAGLGSEIIDIIEQHHGDSTMAFFYNKACEISKNSDQTTVTEESFRYAGPTPRSKEAAIVLIADSVEAAAKSMKLPSPSSLKSMVEKVTYSKFRDHQFDDCELTFRELTIIAQSLYDRLLRKNHNRVEYPGFDFSDKETNGDKHSSNAGGNSTRNLEREDKHR